MAVRENAPLDRLSTSMRLESCTSTQFSASPSCAKDPSALGGLIATPSQADLHPGFADGLRCETDSGGSSLSPQTKFRAGALRTTATDYFIRPFSYARRRSVNPSAFDNATR